VREALAARSGRDFIVSGPSVLSVAAKGCGGALRAVLLLMLRHPAVVMAVLLIAAGLGAVATNALLRQTARHPAPLFGLKALDRGGATAPAPLPPSRPLPVAPPVATPIAPPTMPPAPVLTPTPPAKPAPSRDPIGDMIRAGETGASAARPEAARIAAAQRALTKLGYGPLKADGVAGGGTRQAIERFEKERRLPATGELNPKTIKELSAQASIPIE
jgi:hypothetical protein